MNSSLLVILSSSALLAALLTLIIRRSALRKQLLDIPNDRSLHTVPTPRGGGAAIVLVFIAAIIALMATDYVETKNAMILIGCGSLVALTGFLDDRQLLSHARSRLALHFVAALIAVSALGGLPTLPVFGTGYIVYQLFTWIDSIVPRLLYSEAELQTKGDHFSGWGILMLILVLFVMGWFGSIFINDRIKGLFTRLVDKIPGVNNLYKAISDVMSAFVGKEKKFNQPVLVKVSETMELEMIGFITDTDLSELGNKLVAHATGVKTPFYFFLLRNDEINAFAFFGGHTFSLGAQRKRITYLGGYVWRGNRKRFLRHSIS